MQGWGGGLGDKSQPWFEELVTSTSSWFGLEAQPMGVVWGGSSAWGQGLQGSGARVSGSLEGLAHCRPAALGQPGPGLGTATVKWVGRQPEALCPERLCPERLGGPWKLTRGLGVVLRSSGSRGPGRVGLGRQVP